MSSQSFEYNLVLRIQQAEAQVEQFANRMASLLTEASNRSATAIRNQAEEAARSSENAARRSGEARVEEENRVAQIILVTQDRTASQIERTWTAMYNRIAEQARVTLGGNASNADWFRSQDRLAEINRLGEAFRREFSAEHFEPMIQALERRLRGVSGSLNRLNDPQEEYRRWTQARGETIANFTREAQEIQRVSEIANAAHDRRVAMNKQDEAGIVRRAELEEQENLSNIRALELEDQKTAEAANRAIQDILRRSEQSHALHQKELDYLAQEFAAITRNSAAAQEAANNWALMIGKKAKTLMEADEVRANTPPKKDLMTIIEETARPEREARLKHEQRLLDMQIRNAQEVGKASSDEYDKAEKAKVDSANRHAQYILDMQIDMASKVGSAWSRQYDKQEAAANKVVATNDKVYKKMLRDIDNLEAADAVRYQGLSHYEQALSAQHAKTRQAVQDAYAQRGTLGDQWLKDELARIRIISAAERDREIRFAGEKTNKDLAAFSGGGRTVSNMFQIQQAFEDFQYAGLRGAANNIAMMAANLGGNAGVVALLGIMGAQAATSLGLWDKLNESLGGFLWKLKSVTEEEEKQNKLAEARLDTRTAKADQLRSYDLESYKTLEKKAAKEKDEIKTQEDILSKLQASKAAYDGMAAAADALDSMMPRGWTLNMQSSPEESNQVLGFYKQVLEEGVLLTGAQREYGQELVYSFEAAKKLWEANAGGFTLTEEGYQGVLKKIQETESSLIKMNSQYETTIWLIKNMKQAYEDISKAMSDAFKQSTAFDSSQMKGPAKDFFEEQVKTRQKLVDDIQEEANKKIELAKLAHAAELEIAQNNGDIEAEKAAREKLNKVISEQTKLINDAKNAAMQASEQARTAAEEQTAAYDRAASMQKAALEEHKAELSEIEKKLNATQSLIKADEERVRVLELQKSAFEDQAGKQGVDLTVKQLQHEAELEKDAYKESAKRGKEAFLAEVERIRELARQKLEYQKRHSARGRGDSNPDVALQEQYNREKAAFDEWVTWQIKRNEEADAHNLKRIERQAELDAKAKFKEYDTAQRDKLNQLRDQADKYTSEEKLVEAGEVRKQIDKTLKELAAAQAKMIGQGTKAEGRAARDEWEKLNAQIIENMTKEQELYKQRKAMNEEIAAEQASAVDFIKDRLEEISAIKPFDQSAMGELGGWLQQLNAIKSRMEEIVALSAAINGPNSGASSKPSGKAGLVGGGVGFAVGTDYVPETGLALIHKGEMIIPAEEAAGIRAARNSYLTPTDDSRIRSARLLYNKTYKDANSIYSSTRKELIDSRNSGNTFAVDELENLRRGFEEFQKTMADLNKDLSQYEEAYKKQEADRRRMAETERHNAAMAEIKESAAREKLRREESAKRIREIEAEGKKKSEEILNRGPESTPEYIARRRGEINRRWRDNRNSDDAQRELNDKLPAEERKMAEKLRNETTSAVNRHLVLQSRIVGEIEKTHEMVKEAKSKVENHPLELNKQREAAGDFLEDHGWRKKFLKRKDDTGRDPEGVYSSPQFLADEERRAKEAEKAAKIKRARAMSGMTPSENEKASVESAMQLEQNLERSAKQKALLEAMQAVKEAEVTGANELAAALEKAAAAKEALAAAGNGGGYGSSAPGMGLSGGSAAGIGGGGGGGGGSSPNSLTINNNMTAHMAQASPNAVFAAMAAAAQISGIRRR